MNASKNAIYWAVTGLFGFALAAGGIADVMLVDDMRAAMDHLGYPAYFAQIIGTWKVLGVAALLAPALPRLKEWAYAGFTFNLTGAALSHLAVGDGLGGAAAPLILLAMMVASYAMRPSTRRVELPLPAGAAA